ncbi:preprotein translocase subunit SecE [Aestuariimicrobium sp. p3-SID1156]|nr:preprotein translocase subunit SecE [Aestuariimicrobium sp. p3-SID1156]MCT1458808.1 preprotein translocase subunit SecE [Aestuariimicrobium sp. p3-SID1156]
MTNDRTLPEDEAGNNTLRSGDVESEIVDIDGDEDIQFEDAPSTQGATAADAVVDAEDGVAGENLAVPTDGEADEDDYEIVDDEAEELENADETEDDTPDKGDPEDMVIDDEQQLEEAEAVAAAAKSSRPVKRKMTTAPVKKDKPTPKRTDAGKAVAERKRTTPAAFVKQSAAELKKVIWPNGDTLREYYIVVLVFVIFIIGLVSLLDWAFGWVLLKFLGDN